MRILFVLEHYAPYIGGAETLFVSLAESLVREGYAVRVITTRFQRNLAKRDWVNGVDVRRINVPNRFLFTVAALPAVLRSAGWADLVHTTTYNAALPAWVGAKLRGKASVITFHELWGQLWFALPFLSSLQRWAYYGYERLVAALPFDHYVAVSDFTARSLVQAGIKESRIERIYNGLAYDLFNGVEHRPPQRFIFTYFGRLGVSKGLDLLIPAAAAFCAQYPEAVLRLIIPRRPQALYGTILDLIQSSGLPQTNFELLHELSPTELRAAVATSSCVVIPSYSEGFCFVAAETAALGVPIISSGMGALAETVSGPNVLMQGMTVEALVRCLEAAYRGQYFMTPPRRFPLATAIAHYQSLYTRIARR